MKKLGCDNINGELLTAEQTQSLSNLGMHSVRKIAQEAGAVRRIGRSYRINKKFSLNISRKSMLSNIHQIKPQQRIKFTKEPTGIIYKRAGFPA